jgi:hypothetical protein
MSYDEKPGHPSPTGDDAPLSSAPPVEISRLHLTMELRDDT